MNQLIFWGVVVIFAVGQAFLLHAAWRLRTSIDAPPPGVPRSDPHGDLLWTIGTAAATGALLVLIYQALPLSS